MCFFSVGRKQVVQVLVLCEVTFFFCQQTPEVRLQSSLKVAVYRCSTAKAFLFPLPQVVAQSSTATKLESCHAPSQKTRLLVVESLVVFGSDEAIKPVAYVPQAPRSTFVGALFEGGPYFGFEFSGL